MQLSSAEIDLPARGRFDLRATVLSYGYYELPPYRWEDGRRPVLYRAERLASGRVYLIEVRPAPRGVIVRATGHDADEPEVIAPLAARMRKALRLDEDLAPFHRLCRADAALRPIAGVGLGRLLRGTSLFEDVVKAIAWTNTTWPAAVSMIGRLGRLGSSCPADRKLRAFPTPRQIVRAGAAGLRAETGLGYRAPYLVQLAAEVLTSTRNLVDLEARAAVLPTADLARELLDVRGVGPATAGYLLMMLGHYDRPAIDRATLRYAATLYHGRRPTERALRQRMSRYGAWSGLVCWFLQWLASEYSAVLRNPSAAPPRTGPILIRAT